MPNISSVSSARDRVLRVEGVTKSFGDGSVTAVNNLSLSIQPQEIVCLLGPSGCGKTTLLRLIAGLEHPSAGHIWFGDEEITAVPPHKRGFGLMFQNFALFPHKNVAQNVGFGLKMRGDSPAQIKARVTEMLALVALTGYETRQIDQLSGGEQQRVALARALAPDPPLLMLDEPLGALDRALRERLMLELRGILKRVGVTAVYVTHDQTEAFAISDRMVVMNNGCIEQLDTPQTVYQTPATPFVAQFLGFENLLEAQVVAGGHEVQTAVGSFTLTKPNPKSGTMTLLIRSDAVTEAGNITLTGTVEAVSFRGRYTQIWLKIDQTRLMFELLIPPPTPIGQTMTLTLQTDKLQLL